MSDQPFDGNRGVETFSIGAAKPMTLDAIEQAMVDLGKLGQERRPDHIIVAPKVMDTLRAVDRYQRAIAARPVLRPRDMRKWRRLQKAWRSTKPRAPLFGIRVDVAADLAEMFVRRGGGEVQPSPFFDRAISDGVPVFTAPIEGAAVVYKPSDSG